MNPKIRIKEMNAPKPNLERLKGSLLAESEGVVLPWESGAKGILVGNSSVVFGRIRDSANSAISVA